MSGKPFANVVGGDADDRVLPGVVAGLAMKQLDTDSPLFQPLDATFQRILHEVAEQHLSAVAAGEFGTVENRLEFAPNFTRCVQSDRPALRGLRVCARGPGPMALSFGDGKRKPSKNAIT